MLESNAKGRERVASARAGRLRCRAVAASMASDGCPKTKDAHAYPYVRGRWTSLAVPRPPYASGVAPLRAGRCRYSKYSVRRREGVGGRRMGGGGPKGTPLSLSRGALGVLGAADGRGRWRGEAVPPPYGAAGGSGGAIGVGVARKVTIGRGGVASGGGAPTSTGSEVARTWSSPSMMVKRRTS